MDIKMVKFLQILACKTPVVGGRLWRGQTWRGWMSATMRDGSWSKFQSKVRAGEDAGTAHGSPGKAAEEPGRPESFLLALSVPLSFTLSKMFLKCWATASPLPVIRGKSLLHAMGWHPQPGRCRRRADGHWARQEGTGGSQTAQEAGDSSYTAALADYTPRLPSPTSPGSFPQGEATGSEPGNRSSWGSLPSFYSGALAN